MIRSMTAFASVEAENGDAALGIEVRSVNHRYLELGLRLSDDLRQFESGIRERVAARVARGKVDLSVRFRPVGQHTALQLDEEVLGRLAGAARVMSERMPGLGVDFVSVLNWPGVLAERETDAASLRAAVFSLLDRALDELVATREREGERLAGFLRERLDNIESVVAGVRAHLPEVRAALRAKFDARIADLRQPLDPGRVEQEVVLQLSRMDVDEELDRLATHVAETRRVLDADETVGRRLDFLMQEFNREANTLGSKAADPRTTRAAVELKVLVEQMREQVQNLE
jgi:uncharacterized protein (TIGR00255 family)